MTPEEAIKKYGFSGNVGDMIPMLEEYALLARIQERRQCIYNLEQDLLDNGPEGAGIYSQGYQRCMNDEISNHKAFIEELEKELLTFK